MRTNVSLTGFVGTTYSCDVSAAAHALNEISGLSFVDSLNKRATGALISVETNDVRFAFRTSATSAFGHLLDAGSSIKLTSTSQVEQFTFCLKDPASAATLYATTEFEY